MRVLFTSISELGHIHPMLPLARAGMEHGWEVVWASGLDVCPRLEAVGIATVPAGLTAADRRQLRDGHLAGREIPPAEMADHVFPLFGAIAAPRMFEDLLGFVTTWKPDVVIHDAAEFAGAIIAATLAVPSVTHGYGPLTPPHRVARAGAATAPLWASVGLDAPPYGGSYTWLYLDIYPASLQPTDTSHVPHRQALRPVAFQTTNNTGRESRVAARSSTRPFVYLTFGTVLNQPGRLRTALDAISPLDVSILVTTGPDGNPAALGSQPPNVAVERYIPQAEILPQCTLVVSHGGSGTVLGAASHAIPQLCLPQAADQFLNAHACVRAGNGLALAPDQATAPAIARAVRRLLNEPTFRARANTLASELATMPPPEHVLGVIETLVETRPPETN